jgi:Ribonuclease G/E
MEARKKRQQAKGAILGTCPDCQGTGTIPREAPLLANLKDPAIRAYQKKSKTCPKCNGSGRVGVG